MALRYIDTHSHLHDHYYDADRVEVLARMREAGVGTIAVGTTVDTSRKAAALATGEPDVWGCIGVHPNDSAEVFDETVFAPLINSHIVAVGECGLDYFRGANESEKKRQKANFEAQIAFAQKHQLPLMLHVRPNKGSIDAHDDALDILSSMGFSGQGTSHFFTAPVEVARRYWELGFATSFPGVITFAKDTREAAEQAPDDLYLAETDAPYATPVPYRGQRNEPIRVIEVANKIAEIRATTPEAVRVQLLANAYRIFRLAE